MRLINADALTEMLEHHKKDCNPDHFDGHEFFIDKIDAHDSYGEWQFANGFNLGIVASIVETKHALTIDAVEVVRCEDCKFCRTWYFDKDGSCPSAICTFWDEDNRVNGIDVYKNGFCSNGKRRTDDETY